MQFIYFIAGGQQIDLIAGAGLSDILDDKTKITSRQLFNGPENQSGFLFSFCQPKDLQYKPDIQTWRKSNCGKFHVGFYADNPPTEKELARDVQITGHKIKLWPNEEWIIPLARIFPAGTRLPQSLILGANGEVVAETLPQFCQFSGRCEKFWNDFAVQIGLTEGQAQMTEAESFTLAAEAIKINYRINIDGINALKLFTSMNLAEILLAVVDAPAVMKKMSEWLETNEKKNITQTDLPEPSASGQPVN